MAATIAKATGISGTTSREVTRLGQAASEVEANTWRTFTKARVRKDGSGFVEVCRDMGDGRRVCLGRVEFGPEAEQEAVVVTIPGTDSGTGCILTTAEEASV